MFDDGIPAGYCDADIEQNELERLGNASAEAKARGECPHGWRQGEGEGPRDRPPRASDPVRCLDCGKRSTEGELDAERDFVLGR